MRSSILELSNICVSINFFLFLIKNGATIAGAGTVVEVVSSTLERLCEDLEADKLNVMWKCLIQEINESIKNKNTIHLSRLLSVLTASVRVQKGLKVHGE